MDFVRIQLLLTTFCCPPIAVIAVRMPSICIRLALRFELNAGGTRTRRFKYEENANSLWPFAITNSAFNVGFHMTINNRSSTWIVEKIVDEKQPIIGRGSFIQFSPT